MTLMFALLLLFACCVSGATNGRFIHLTDIHLDSEYKVGGDTVERCVNITGSSANATAAKWGSYPCDLPQITFTAALNELNALTGGTPDWVFWTGDSVPHYLDYSSVEQYTYEMVLDGCTSVVNQLKLAFKGIPVYPALGNHDNFLSDQLPPPPASDSWLGIIADLWSEWLPEDALATVRYGGYYTTLIKPGLRVLSFNSIYCDKINLYAVLNQTDHAEQFVWMASVLQNARAQNEKVYIIGHIVPTDYYGKCGQWYHEIAVEYSDVIVSHFYGDRHSDEIRIIYNATTPVNPVGIIYVNPSLVPFSEFNPTLRLFAWDNITFDILDSLTYYVPLDIQGNFDNLTWSLEYSAVQAYGIAAPLTAYSWAKFFQQMTQNNHLLQLYSKFYYHAASVPCGIPCQGDILASTIYTTKASAESSDSGVEGSAECGVCLSAMSIVDTLLKENKSAHEILKGVSKICSIQPVWPRNVCEGFVRLYGPSSLPIIASLENPSRVCYALELCS